MTRPDSFGIRFLVSAATIAGALAVWISLAHEAPPDVVLSQDPVEAAEVIDVTVSASGLVRR